MLFFLLAILFFGFLLGIGMAYEFMIDVATARVSKQQEMPVDSFVYYFYKTCLSLGLHSSKDSSNEQNSTLTSFGLTALTVKFSNDTETLHLITT